MMDSLGLLPQLSSAGKEGAEQGRVCSRESAQRHPLGDCAQGSDLTHYSNKARISCSCLQKSHPSLVVASAKRARHATATRRCMFSVGECHSAGKRALELS